MKYSFEDIRNQGLLLYEYVRGSTAYELNLIVVGDHTVMFIGNAERIEVRHQAHSREVFVGGAVLAAKWVVSQKKGVVYEMADVLA